MVEWRRGQRCELRRSSDGIRVAQLAKQFAVHRYFMPEGLQRRATTGESDCKSRSSVRERGHLLHGSTPALEQAARGLAFNQPVFARQEWWR